MEEKNRFLRRQLAFLEELLEKERGEIKNIITGDIQTAYCEWIHKEQEWIVRIRELLN